jgi:hypothetical protein
MPLKHFVICATSLIYFYNVHMKQLQHTSETLAIYAASLIYFCNIHIKQWQHTSETSKTLETYACNVRFHRNIPLLKSCVTITTASFVFFFLKYPKEFCDSYMCIMLQNFVSPCGPKNSGTREAQMPWGPIEPPTEETES